MRLVDLYSALKLEDDQLKIDILRVLMWRRCKGPCSCSFVHLGGFVGLSHLCGYVNGFYTVPQNVNCFFGANHFNFTMAYQLVLILLNWFISLQFHRGLLVDMWN